MAIFNEILVGRFNRGLQKLFGIKGPPPVRQLAGEIQPSHQLFSGCENRFLEGWTVFGSGVAIAGGATTPQVRIRNPLGSNVIGVISKLSFFSSLGGQESFISMSTGLADLSSSNGVRCLDNRPVKGAASTLGATLRVSSQAAGSLVGGVIYRAQPLASVEQQYVTTEFNELPLLPDDCIDVFINNTVGTLLNVTFQWRERPLEESERT
jgi:hypothetical protein